jgi:hypothetical protein
MSDLDMTAGDLAPEPVLADPILAPAALQGVGLASAGVVLAGIVLAALWLAGPRSDGSQSHIPASPADLSAGIITPIDSNDRAAVDAAISALNIDDPLRRQIEREVLAGNRRIGWIVVEDSMDPDGDTIAIESGGIVQQVVLDKAWKPIPVLVGDSNRIGITAIKDGEGGGITLALVTAGGHMTMRPLTPGEHFEVAAQ